MRTCKDAYQCPKCREYGVELVDTELGDDYLIVTQFCHKCNETFYDGFNLQYVGWYHTLDDGKTCVEYDAMGNETNRYEM